MKQELTAPVGDKEAELRQQLLFSEQRKLLDDFLLDVQQTPRLAKPLAIA